MKYDLIVVGGGFSGVAAAVAAARQGANALIIEHGGALGGAAVNCLINPFMPNGTKIGEEKKYTELTQGLYAEICGRLDKDFSAIRNRHFHEEYLKIVLDRMCKEAGVKVCLRAADSVEAVRHMLSLGLDYLPSNCMHNSLEGGI